MLFEILVHIPSLLMAEIAWWVCFGSAALTSLVMLFAIAIGILALRWRRAERQLAHSDQSREPPLVHA